MRIIAILLFTLAAIVFACAVLFYVFITGMACGYAPNSSGCRAWPWELGSDDLLLLVQLPGGIVAGLVALGWLARRKALRAEGQPR